MTFSLFSPLMCLNETCDICDIVKEKILQDTNATSRTNPSVDAVVDLLKLCSCSTCFQWRDTFYEQTSWWRHGGFNSFRFYGLIQPSHQTQFGKRFVMNDVFLIWSHGKDELKLSLQYIIGIHPSMNFTTKRAALVTWLPFSLEILLLGKNTLI